MRYQCVSSIPRCRKTLYCPTENIHTPMEDKNALEEDETAAARAFILTVFD